MNGLNEITENSEKVVMNYVKALDSKNYDLAASYIADDVEIIGPVGESFGKPKDFTTMLKRYNGDYKILKKFVNGNEVALFYDFISAGKTVYMNSWYKVKGGKIIFIRTVFDPSAFVSEREG